MEGQGHHKQGKVEVTTIPNGVEKQAEADVDAMIRYRKVLYVLID